MGGSSRAAMVWLSTLSFDISDPLCGFRGIPLAETVALIDSVATGDAMEFDPELVIRLHWRGLRDPQPADARRLRARRSLAFPHARGQRPHDVALHALARPAWGSACRCCCAGAPPRRSGDVRDERGSLGAHRRERRMKRDAFPDVAELIPHARRMLLLSSRDRAWSGRTPCAPWTSIAASCSGMPRAACPPGSGSSTWRSASPSTDRWSRAPRATRRASDSSSAAGA